MGKSFRFVNRGLGMRIEEVDTDRENEIIGYAFAIALPLIQNFLISYLYLGGSLSDFKNDTWVPFIKMNLQSFGVTFIVLTLVMSLIYSFTSDFIEQILPKSLGIVFGLGIGWKVAEVFDLIYILSNIEDTASLIVAAFFIFFTIFAACVGGFFVYLPNYGIEVLGHMVRRKIRGLF